MTFFPSGDFIDLITLSSLEIILGVDNIIFIALLIQHLPQEQRIRARAIGLSLAFVLRVMLLFAASWVMKLTEPLFMLFSFVFSGRNLLLIIGGLFLVVKAFLEVREMFDDKVAPDPSQKNCSARYRSIVTQIIFVDLILSFDSIITAVGMTSNLSIIIIAILVAMIVMMVSAQKVGDFIYRYPSVKVIALFFIGLIGIMLIFNGFDKYFSKSLLYSTALFAVASESVNIALRKKAEKNEVKK